MPNTMENVPDPVPDPVPGPVPGPVTGPVPESFDLLPYSDVKLNLDVKVGYINAVDEKDNYHCISICNGDFHADLITNGSKIKSMRLYEPDPQSIQRDNMGEVLLVVLVYMVITKEVAIKYKDDKKVVFIGCIFEQHGLVPEWVFGLDYRMFVSCNGLHIYGSGVLDNSDIIGSVYGLERGNPDVISNVNFYMCNMSEVLSRLVIFREIGFAMCAFDMDALLPDEDLWYHIGMFNENYVRGIDFKSMDFADRNLSYNIFSDSDLTRVNLAGANLTGAIISDSNLDGANLAGSNLTGAIISGSKLDGAYMDDNTIINDTLIGKGVHLGDYIGCKRCGIAIPYINKGSIQQPTYTIACPSCVEDYKDARVLAYLVCCKNEDIHSIVMSFWS